MENKLPVPQLDQKPKNIPTVFIIFGATGDLMGKKIVPALFHLYKKNKLPKMFKIIGFSRRELSSEQFIKLISEILKKHNKGILPQDAENFLNYFMFQNGNFDDVVSYKSLAAKLGIIDGGWNVCSNKLFYLAVPPSYYENISKHLAASGLTIPCGPDEGWTRVIVEKPFGKNLKSAESLDVLLSKLFKEEQIYRIDHYLAKEMLQNILAFRFGNNLFEDIWNNKYIERIDIRTRESIGAEGRGAFYDGIGALRDVGQNHLLQMLSLVTMENPGVLDSIHVRKKRAQLLQSIAKLTKKEINTQTFRAQYKGYREIDGVKKNSNTETYFKVIAKINNERWENVLVTLEAGKKLPLKKEIVVTFKHPTPCFCPNLQHLKNRIIFSMEPKEGIVIEFYSKKPGLDYKFTRRKLNFINRRISERQQYVEEYEKLLLDCISGNQILFISTPEITSTWKYIDPIVQSWEKNEVILESYKPFSRKAIIAAEKIGNFNLTNKKEIRKEVGVIGLGKMGGNLARRLTSKGWIVTGFNRTAQVTRGLEKEGIKGSYSLEEFVKSLKKPRIIITILTAGKPTDEILEKLSTLLSPGDIVAEFSNSLYKDSVRRSILLKKKKINFIDVGISGGPEGALNGACLMIGGETKIFEKLKKLFIDIAAPNAYMHFPGIGAGHFVKMVHNGIEYGMMQSIAEGFNLLKNGPYKNLRLTDITTIYQNRSVIESRLVGWLDLAFKKYGENLKNLSGSVGFTGEGEWTVKIAQEYNLDIQVILDSFKFRVNSQKKPSYTGKILTGIRNQFGGHSIEKGKMT